MQDIPQAVILQHARENIKKCTLTPLRYKKEVHFYTYPSDLLKLKNHHPFVLLDFEGPVLSPPDSQWPILLIDATWRYAKKMKKALPSELVWVARSLPSSFSTAYPRKQTDCLNPDRGLASVEALYLAYYLMGYRVEELLQDYYWKDLFLERNKALLS